MTPPVISLPVEPRGRLATPPLPAWRAGMLPESSPWRYALYLYGFLIFSRILDWTIPNMKIPLVLGTVLLIAAVAKGALQIVFSSTAGRLLIVLTILMCLSTVQSVWPGGSVELLVDKWSRALGLFLILVGLLRTSRECYGFLLSMLAGLTITGIQSLVSGGTVTGRLVLTSSRYGDPNDLALAMLVAGALGCLLIVSPLSRGSAYRLLGYIGVVSAVTTFAQTGSRGGLLGFAAMIAYLMRSWAWKTRILGGVALALGVVVALLLLPEHIATRYTTMATSNDSSKQGRTELLKQSLRITAAHPMLGVGPGMFVVAEHKDAVARFQTRGSWHVTHNMYTQVLSEVGIPALAVFLLLVRWSWRAFARTKVLRAREDPAESQVGWIAYWMAVAFAGYLAAGFFLSIAYDELIMIFAALAVTVSTLGQQVSGRPPQVLQPDIAHGAPWSPLRRENRGERVRPRTRTG